jgi:aspartyl-tRNA synthetase
MAKNFIQIRNLDDKYLDSEITIYGRINNIRKVGAKTGFIILRDQLETIQCVCGLKFTDSFENLIKLPSESYVYLTGKLAKLPDNVEKIKSCTITNFEFIISSWSLEGSVYHTPFILADANFVTINNDDDENSNDRAWVSKSTKLNFRYFDLRCPINFCIFKARSMVLKSFRKTLDDMGFMEINSPKLIGASSEGGSSVFPVKYFDKMGYLAQSPQLYKQMAINADFTPLHI